VDQSDAGTRERILEATVKLLFSTAPGELTTRRISGEAQVNVAAINYHFRSKDELVNTAMEAATAKAFEMGVAVLRAPGKPARARLLDFLGGYAAGLVKFPGLTRTAFLGLFTREDSETFYGRYMKEMVVRVAEALREMEAEKAGAQADGSGGQGGAAAGAGQGSVVAQDNAAAALMILSCVIFPYLLPHTMRDAGAVDYSDDQARRRYIDGALARIAGA
jgi:AcrR family transcriptional regulator